MKIRLIYFVSGYISKASIFDESIDNKILRILQRWKFARFAKLLYKELKENFPLKLFSYIDWILGEDYFVLTFLFHEFSWEKIYEEIEIEAPNIKTLIKKTIDEILNLMEKQVIMSERRRKLHETAEKVIRMSKGHKWLYLKDDLVFQPLQYEIFFEEEKGIYHILFVGLLKKIKLQYLDLILYQKEKSKLPNGISKYNIPEHYLFDETVETTVGFSFIPSKGIVNATGEIKDVWEYCQLIEVKSKVKMEDEKFREIDETVVEKGHGAYCVRCSFCHYTIWDFDIEKLIKKANELKFVYDYFNYVYCYDCFLIREK